MAFASRVTETRDVVVGVSVQLTTEEAQYLKSLLQRSESSVLSDAIRSALERALD